MSRECAAFDVAEQLTRIADIVHTVERRVLHLIQEGATKGTPFDDIGGELSLLAKDVKRSYRRIVELRDQRNIGFKAEGKLLELERHCIWLYRRTQLEHWFFRKLQLETKLRDLISAPAFELYQEILDAHELAREVVMRSDEQTKSLLLEEEEIPPMRAVSG